MPKDNLPGTVSIIVTRYLVSCWFDKWSRIGPDMHADTEREKEEITGKNSPGISEKLIRILKETDQYVVIFRMKTEIPRGALALNDKALQRLYEFIKAFKNQTHLIDAGVDDFMVDLLNRVIPSSIGLFTKSLSHFPSIDLKHYREMFGYSKIYRIFTDTVENIFESDVDHFHLSFLIRLLDNNDLVYKNLLHVISKLNLFVSENMVDKNIVSCSAVLTSIVQSCPEKLNEVLVMSLLSYLVGIMQNPQNYLFLNYEDSKVVGDAILALIRFKYTGIEVKKVSVGLLRECIARIEMYSSSSVYEEIMVVVMMMRILRDVFDLCVASGNREFGFVNAKFADFMLMDKKVKDKEMESKKNKAIDVERSEILFERPFNNRHNAKFQVLRDEYITRKYIFLDALNEYIDVFDRISFYNDISRLEDPSVLFSRLNSLKKYIDWSEMIVFVCNSPSKERCTPFVFDDYYVKNLNHAVYLKLFINNSNTDSLVYSTRMAVDKECISLLAPLYLSTILNEDMKSRKIREIVLRYLNGLGCNGSGTNPVGNNMDTETNEGDSIDKQIAIEVTKKTDEDLGIVEKTRNITINEITRLHHADDKWEWKQFSIGNLISHDDRIDSFLVSFFDSELPHEVNKNIAMLMIVVISKEPSERNIQKLVEYLRKCLEACQISSLSEETYACICSMLLSIGHTEYFTDDNRIGSYHDLVISLLRIATQKQRNEYTERIRKQGFDVIFSLDQNRIYDIGLLNEPSLSSRYLRTYQSIRNMISGEK